MSLLGQTEQNPADFSSASRTEKAAQTYGEFRVLVREIAEDADPADRASRLDNLARAVFLQMLLDDGPTRAADSAEALAKALRCIAERS